MSTTDARTDPSLDGLAVASCATVRTLIEDAESLRTRHDRATRRRFTRLFRDPGALGVTITLTDEVMRFTSVSSAVRTLRVAAGRSSVAGFGALNAYGLRLSAVASRVAPRLVLHAVHARVRGLSQDLIVDADPTRFADHIRRRQRAGLRLNVNVLGEAVLGEAEAGDRLARVVEMMARPDVQYVSVKLSSVVSQIVTIDHDGSLERVAERLRTLYRTAAARSTFVNLDMEEFRDLRLTLDAFRRVLGEPEFHALPAGIVLQAYLPESHRALDELLTWVRDRHRRGGAPIKIRLVKGANLAMEHAEAELHGWSGAPYVTKADVDASYLRLLDVCLKPEHADAVRIGVASHNLFDVVWALDVARARGVEQQVDVEMLEGMANAEALALARRGVPVVLYTPVTRRDDFAAAVAYLVRRLDENTSKDNYLSAAFAIVRDPTVFADQQRRFLDSINERHGVATVSRRHAARPIQRPAFDNEPDGDPTDPRFVEAIVAANREVRSLVDVWVGEDAGGSDAAEGRDPSAEGAVWYRYRVANRALVDAAVATARSAWPSWDALSGAGRGAVMRRVADIMARDRARSISVMARDGGKTVAEADPEVTEAIDFVRYYATRMDGLGDSSPVGVVVVVPPWNFPYAIPAGGVAAALCAGNAVILKPAPESVATAWELARQFWEGGVPTEVLQFLPTRDDENGQRLVTHEDVDAVVLTGSFETARLFTRWRPSMTLLGETSGKNALVVTACADIDLAVRDLVQSAFGHAGQKCSAASLAIVEESVYRHPGFVRQLRDAVTGLRVGRAYDLATSMGPIIRPPEPALRRALLDLDDGESWLVAPEPLDDSGYLWRPGVRMGVRPGSWSHHHEWFGPVLGVMPAPDLATAITWQNEIEYGLTAGLHSLDVGECARWIDGVQAGNLYVNRGTTGAIVSRQSFGGWKRSGVGPTHKTGGPNYVNALRRWPAVRDADGALAELGAWWAEIGSQARDESGLSVERNLHRYRRALGPIVVRVDDSLSDAAAAYLRGIAARTSASIELSAALLVSGEPRAVIESIDALVARSAGVAKVRWLSAEPAPSDRLLDVGVSTDRRPLAQAGAVEGPRWLLEQSVTVTNHRYGNVNAGPKPKVRGLGEVAVDPR